MHSIVPAAAFGVVLTFLCVTSSASQSMWDLVPPCVANSTERLLGVFQVLPKYSEPHVDNMFDGYLSMLRGPSAFVVNEGLLALNGTAAEQNAFATIIADARVHTVARFEFSVGSFISTSFFFLIISKVAKKSVCLRSLSSATSLRSFSILTLISAIPLGIPVLETIAAMASVSFLSYFPSALLGSLLRPYVALLVVTGLRSMAACSQCPLTARMAGAALGVFSKPQPTPEPPSTAYQSLLLVALSGSIASIVCHLVYLMWNDEEIDADVASDEE